MMNDEYGMMNALQIVVWRNRVLDMMFGFIIPYSSFIICRLHPLVKSCFKLPPRTSAFSSSDSDDAKIGPMAADK